MSGSPGNTVKRRLKQAPGAKVKTNKYAVIESVSLNAKKTVTRLSLDSRGCAKVTH